MLNAVLDARTCLLFMVYNYYRTTTTTYYYYYYYYFGFCVISVFFCSYSDYSTCSLSLVIVCLFIEY